MANDRYQHVSIIAVSRLTGNISSKDAVHGRTTPLQLHGTKDSANQALDAQSIASRISSLLGLVLLMGFLDRIIQ